MPGRQGFRQLAADVAAPRDQDLVIRGLRGVEGTDEMRQGLAGGEEKDLIQGLDHRRRPGDDDLSAAINGHQPAGQAGDELGQAAQGLSGHRATRLDPDHRQLGATIDKIEDLQASGLIDQVGDRLGDQALRTDDMVDGNGPGREELGMGQVVGVADPRQAGGGLEEQVGKLTGDHVGLVAVGDRQHQIGLLDPGLDQHVGVGGMADDRAQIEAFLKQLQ